MYRHPASAITTLALAAFATGQCQTQWLPGEPLATPSGTIAASVVWDPDGGGPLSSVLVVAGNLAVANTPHAVVATYDGSRWTPLGDLPGNARALGVNNGQLFVSTTYTTTVAGFSITVEALQVWNGTAWSSLGNMGGQTLAMTSYNGQLVVGGTLTSVGGLAVSGVAAWNGTTWSALGSGVQGTVRAFQQLNGVLWVGGSLTNAGGVAVGNLAFWNGTTWSAGPTFQGGIETMALRSNTSLASTAMFVGGSFTSLTVGAQTIPVARLARFNAAAQTWDNANGGVPGSRCTALLVRATGINSYELAATVQDANTQQRAFRMVGTTWSPLATLGDGTLDVWPATLSFYGGRYTVGLSSSPNAVRTFDGTAWVDVRGRGIAGDVYSVMDGGSDLVIGGSFTTASGVTLNNVARGSFDAWTPLGSGVQGGLGVFALALAPNGDVIATGDFTLANGLAANRIARWNGSSWSPLGTGLDAPGYAVCVLDNGDVVVAGAFTTAGGITANRVARWNGSAWNPLGTGFDAQANAMRRLANGDLLVGGDFTTAGGIAANRIARWNGSSWSALGSGCNGSVLALAEAPNGDIYAGGTFTTAGTVPTRIGCWRAGAWQGVIGFGLNAIPVDTLVVHPGGDLFVGGGIFSFSLGPFGGWSSNLLRLTAGSLQPQPVLGTNIAASCIADGDLVITGRFDAAGGLVANHLARLHSTCAAHSTPSGTGCAGLTAPLSLQALIDPWLGGSWQLRGATFGSGAFAVRALGFTAQATPIPLAAFLAGAQPGCVGLVTPDVLEIHVPGAATLTLTSAVPNDPALVGAALYEQLLQLEPRPTGGFAISSSNAVQLVVGAF